MVKYLILSDAPRWVYCGASVTGWEQLEDEAASTNPAAEEGKAAHYVLERLLHGDVDANSLIGQSAPNNFIIDKHMVNYALRSIPEIKPLIDFVRCERKITLVSEQGTRIYGRYDLGGGQASTKTLRMFDYKYGYSVIEPEQNYQLLGGTAGMLQELTRDQFDWVEMIVIQPRAHHPKGPVRKWTISINEFWDHYAWMMRRADEVKRGNQPFVPGPWCKYCKKQHGCSALRAAGLQVVDQVEQGFFEELDADALSFERQIVNRNLKTLKEYSKALDMQIVQRLRKGEYIPKLMAEPQYGRDVWIEPEVLKTFEAIMPELKLHKDVPLTPKQAIEAGLPEKLVLTLIKTPMTGYGLVEKDQVEEARKVFNVNKT